MAIEEPKYDVISKSSHFEIRSYAATLIAETEVHANFENAGKQAFKILAGYIFGNNRKKQKIAMTAPVSQVPVSEKISMTAPVNQIKTSAGFLVQFTMPSHFSKETLPEPVDTRVTIREVPAKNVAVFGYSGSWSESRYQQKLTQFKQELESAGIRTLGEPTLARFNSPFQIWFLRRNEIWLEVKPSLATPN